MKKRIIIIATISITIILFAVLAVLFFGIKIGDFEIKPIIHITIGTETNNNNSNNNHNNNTTPNTNNKSEDSNETTKTKEEKTTVTNNITTQTTNTQKRKSYKYVFTTNGAAILKQTTSDNPTTWYSAICSNCGAKSKMYVNSGVSFNFMSDQVTDTYKKKVHCDTCKKPYDIEITCQRIEKQ